MMMNNTVSAEPKPGTINTPMVRSYLRVRGWKDAESYFGEIAMESPCGEWRVEIDKDNWLTLRHFTDSDVQVQDVGAVATPRWVTDYEYENWSEAKKEMVSLGALPWECPNCGEIGGDPREQTSAPFLYGSDADGNRGEWRTETIEGCSLCLRRRFA